MVRSGRSGDGRLCEYFITFHLVCCVELQRHRVITITEILIIIIDDQLNKVYKLPVTFVF